MFNTVEDSEHERLLEQAQVWDPVTCRRLRDIGVGQGWRCLEVGAGTGTVVRWLADEVGPAGRVVGTDLETKWLSAIQQPNVEAIEHDFTSDPLDACSYDLICLRMVLAHQADKRAGLRTLVDALAPGGWMLVEECDLRTLQITHPPDETWHAVGGAVLEVIEGAGADPHLGIEVPGMVEAAGLVDVDAEAVAFPRRAPMIQPWRRQFVELRDRLVGTGLVTAEEIDGVIARFDDPDCGLVVHGPTMVSVRARKPR